MTVSSILVTGASGLLGSTLFNTWQHRYRVVAASHSHKLHCDDVWIGDLSTPEAARNAIQRAKPDLVVHAAAFTDLDACEADPSKAMKVNAEATGKLASEARRAGSAFAYISTESVFDGGRGNYRESDATNPINHYAASKLAGEREALAAHPGALVLRIGLEGWRPRGSPGFVQWLVDGLRKGERRTICTDWIHTVVFAQNLAEITEKLWKAEASGIFHCGAEIPASNWEIAQTAAEVFGLDSSLLIPINSDELQLRALRPKNVSLQSGRLREKIGNAVWNLRQGLIKMHFQETSGELAAIRSLVRA